MKQTALEFYAEQEVKLTLDFLANKINQVEYGIKRVKLIEQAKEMEKEQIVIAYQSDRNPCSDEDAEEYYIRTYEGEQ